MKLVDSQHLVYTAEADDETTLWYDNRRIVFPEGAWYHQSRSGKRWDHDKESKRFTGKVPLLEDQEIANRFYQNQRNTVRNNNDLELRNMVLDLREQVEILNRNRRRLTYECVIYSLFFIFLTIIFRMYDGFDFKTLTSLYLMVL